MAFNSKKFKQEKFMDRTADVPVPDMAQWFDEKDKPVWIVRGLTGKEIGIAKESASKNKSITAILELLKSAKVTDKTEALASVFDMDPKGTPDDVAQRMAYLMAGSVDPVCDLQLAKKLCEAFPIEFYTITSKILEITGKGRMPGKPKKSGKKQT